MVKPRYLKMAYELIESALRNRGVIPGKSGRHMKFPYTFSAKIAQFPIFFYMKNNWIWMYYPLGGLVAFYIFGKINALANSDENVRNWAKTQLRNAEKEAHH